MCQPTPPSSVSQKFFGCDGVMMLRRIAHGRRGARGALMQVSAASAAPLPSRPRGRGMSAALDLRPGPSPLAVLALLESEGFRRSLASLSLA